MLARTAVIETMTEIFAAENGTEMSKAEASRMLQLVLKAIPQVIEEQVTVGEGLYLCGLGTFKKVYRKATTARNPKTGEAIAVPAKIVLKFKPARELRAVEAE